MRSFEHMEGQVIGDTGRDFTELDIFRIMKSEICPTVKMPMAIEAALLFLSKVTALDASLDVIKHCRPFSACGMTIFKIQEALDSITAQCNDLIGLAMADAVLEEMSEVPESYDEDESDDMDLGDEPDGEDDVDQDPIQEGR